MFWHYSQNNSGGSFDFDKVRGITHNVVIEADSAEDADRRAENIGLYFDGSGDCPCCGNRWSGAWDDGDDVPKIYDRELGVKYENNWGWMEPGYEIAVHFKDGTIRWYYHDFLENTNP